MISSLTIIILSGSKIAGSAEPPGELETPRTVEVAVSEEADKAIGIAVIVAVGSAVGEGIGVTVGVGGEVETAMEVGDKTNCLSSFPPSSDSTNNNDCTTEGKAMGISVSSTKSLTDGFSQGTNCLRVLLTKVSTD